MSAHGASRRGNLPGDMWTELSREENVWPGNRQISTGSQGSLTQDTLGQAQQNVDGGETTLK